MTPRTIAAVFLWVVLLLNVSLSWLVRAQGQTPAAPARGAVAALPAEAPNFVGKTTSLDASDITSGRRLFLAGGRSNWHSHPNGQLILNESGEGLHQIQGQQVERLKAGQSTYVGPNVVHWHGAAAGSPMTQVNIGFGGTTSWFAAVTDAEYAGKTK